MSFEQSACLGVIVVGEANITKQGVLRTIVIFYVSYPFSSSIKV